MKKFVIVLFVLLLASSSVWAFQGWDLFGKESSEELVVVSEIPLEDGKAKKLAKNSQETIEVVQEDLQKKLTESEAESLESEQKETSNQLKNVVEEYSTASRLTKNQLLELMDKLNVVSDDIDLLIADNEYKDAMLHKVNFFANTGMAFGFRNGSADKTYPTLGLLGNVGIKLPNGIQVGTGCQYMLVDFCGQKKIDFSWDISKLTITATVGFEW